MRCATSLKREFQGGKQMVNKSIRLCALFFIIFLLSIFTSAQDTQKNFLWKVKAETGSAYILGSVHFMKKDIYPLSTAIENAFEKSDVLVVEANINNIAQIDMQGFMEKAFYYNNETLEKNLSKKAFELVKKKLSEHGIPIEIANLQRPWALALTLTSLELVKAGYDPMYGIDFHFITKAKNTKKITELESLDYQMNLFSNLTAAEQEQFLLYTLSNLDILEQQVEEIEQAWLSGNTQAIELILAKAAPGEKQLSSFYQKFIYDRNRSMALKIQEFLKEGETHFVVVGAAHLVGTQGIIKLLEQKGYRIEQL